MVNDCRVRGELAEGLGVETNKGTLRERVLLAGGERVEVRSTVSGIEGSRVRGSLTTGRLRGRMEMDDLVTPLPLTLCQDTTVTGREGGMRVHAVGSGLAWVHSGLFRS